MFECLTIWGAMNLQEVRHSSGLLFSLQARMWIVCARIYYPCALRIRRGGAYSGVRDKMSPVYGSAAQGCALPVCALRGGKLGLYVSRYG